MKVGDIVRVNGDVRLDGKRGQVGVVVSELRHGINRSFVDILLDGEVVSLDWKALRVISESR